MNTRIEANFNDIQRMCKFYQKYDVDDSGETTNLCYYSETDMKDMCECDAFHCPFVNLSNEDDLK